MSKFPRDWLIVPDAWRTIVPDKLERWRAVLATIVAVQVVTCSRRGLAVPCMSPGHLLQRPHSRGLPAWLPVLRLGEQVLDPYAPCHVFYNPNMLLTYETR